MSLPAWLTGLKGLVPDFIGHAEDRLKKSVQERLKEFDENLENGLPQAPGRKASSPGVAQHLMWRGISAYSKAEAELEYHKKKIKFPIDETKDEEVLASIIKAEKPDKYDDDGFVHEFYQAKFEDAELAKLRNMHMHAKMAVKDDNDASNDAKKARVKLEKVERDLKKAEDLVNVEKTKKAVKRTQKTVVPGYEELPKPASDAATTLTVLKEDVLPEPGAGKQAGVDKSARMVAGIWNGDLNPIAEAFERKVLKSAKNANDVMRLLAADSRPCQADERGSPGRSEEIQKAACDPEKPGETPDAVLTVVNPADYEKFSDGLRKYAAARDAARLGGGGDYVVNDEEERILKGGMSVAAGRMLEEKQEKNSPEKPDWLKKIEAAHKINSDENKARIEKWLREAELFYDDPAAYFKMKAWEKAGKAKTYIFDSIINSADRLKEKIKKRASKKPTLRGKKVSSLLQVLIFVLVVATIVNPILGFSGSPHPLPSMEAGLVVEAVMLVLLFVLTIDRTEHYGLGEDPEDVRLTKYKGTNRIIHQFLKLPLYLLPLAAIIGLAVVLKENASAAAGAAAGAAVLFVNIGIGVLAAYAPAKLESLLMQLAKFGGKRLLAFLKSKSITVARVITAALIAWAYCITGLCISRKKKSNKISLVTIREMKLAMYKEIERARERGDNPNHKLDIIPMKFYNEFRNERGDLNPFKYLKPPGPVKEDKIKIDTSGLCSGLLGMIFGPVRYCCSCAWCPSPEFNPCLNCLWAFEKILLDCLRLIVVPISMIPCFSDLDVGFLEDCADCFLDGWDCKELHQDCSKPDVADFGDVLPDYLPRDSIGHIGIVTMKARDGKAIGNPVRGKILWQGYDNFLPVPLVAVEVDKEDRKMYDEEGFDKKGKPTTHTMVHPALEPVEVINKIACLPCCGKLSKGGFDGKYLGRSIHPDDTIEPEDTIEDHEKGDAEFEDPFDKKLLAKFTRALKGFDDTRTLVVPASMVKIYTPDEFAASVAIAALLEEFKDKKIQFENKSWSLTDQNTHANGNKTVLEALAQLLGEHATVSVEIYGITPMPPAAADLEDREMFDHLTKSSLADAGFPAFSPSEKSLYFGAARAHAVRKWLIDEAKPSNDATNSVVGQLQDRLTVFVEKGTATEVTFKVATAIKKKRRPKKGQTAVVSEQPRPIAPNPAFMW